ncbi:SseB family protein [Micromonospora purpureochromogenes]|uniref:SseB family protein n=1 Tax=Micromonospora purpureochromogenes TaxID=47872 RepID=UPI0033F50344
MTATGWPEIVARLHRTLVACDRDTDVELSAGSRRLRLSVRRDTVEGHCPGYAGQALAELGWRPGDDGDWWYATPRTAEGLHWWSGFAARTAAVALTADPAALSCRVRPLDGGAEPPTATGVEATGAAGSGVGAPAPAGLGVAVPPGLSVPVSVEAGAGVSVPAGLGVPVPVEAGAGVPSPVEGGAGADATAASLGNTVADRGGSRPAESEPAELLARAAAAHDLPRYVGVLAAGPVCVPLAGEPSPDRDFPWTVVLGADRAPLLPVFTSADALTAFAGVGVPFVALSAADLLADWPDPAWGLAVDPGAAHGLTLTAPALAALLAANDPTDPPGPLAPATVEQPGTSGR